MAMTGQLSRQAERDQASRPSADEVRELAPFRPRSLLERENGVILVRYISAAYSIAERQQQNSTSYDPLPKTQYPVPSTQYPIPLLCLRYMQIVVVVKLWKSVEEAQVGHQHRVIAPRPGARRR